MIIKDGVSRTSHLDQFVSQVKNAFRRKSKDPHSLASSQTPSAVIQIDGCSSPSESSSTFAPISRENTFGPTYGTSKALHPGRNVDHSSLEKSTDSTIKEGGPRRRLQEQVSRESSSGRGAGGSSREFVPHCKPEQDVSSGPWVANDQVEALKLDFSYMQSEEYIRSSHNIARMESSEAMAMRHNGLKSPISSVFEDGYAPQSSTVSKINASDSQRSAASKPRPAKMSHESIPPNGGNLIRSAKSYVMESPEPRTSGMTRSTRSYVVEEMRISETEHLRHLKKDLHTKLHKPSEVQFHTRMIAPIDAMSAILDNSGSLGSRSTVRFSMSDVDTMSRSKNIGDVPCASKQTKETPSIIKNRRITCDNSDITSLREQYLKASALYSSSKEDVLASTPHNEFKQMREVGNSSNTPPSPTPAQRSHRMSDTGGILAFRERHNQPPAPASLQADVLSIVRGEFMYMETEEYKKSTDSLIRR